MATALPGRPRSGPWCRGSADKARYVKAALPARPLPRTVPARGAPTRSFKPPRPACPRSAPFRRFAFAPGGAPVHNGPYPLRHDTRALPTGTGPGLPATAGPTPRASPRPSSGVQAGLVGQHAARRPHPARQGPRGRASSSRRFARWPAASSGATTLATPHASPELQRRNSRKRVDPRAVPGPDRRPWGILARRRSGFSVSRVRRSPGTAKGGGASVPASLPTEHAQ